LTSSAASARSCVTRWTRVSRPRSCSRGGRPSPPTCHPLCG
jgi:hypothetical protein